jgi:hypothetical protein
MVGRLLVGIGWLDSGESESVCACVCVCLSVCVCVDSPQAHYDVREEKQADNGTSIFGLLDGEGGGARVRPASTRASRGLGQARKAFLPWRLGGTRSSRIRRIPSWGQLGRTSGASSSPKLWYIAVLVRGCRRPWETDGVALGTTCKAKVEGGGGWMDGWMDAGMGLSVLCVSDSRVVSRESLPGSQRGRDTVGPNILPSLLVCFGAREWSRDLGSFGKVHPRR